MTRDQLVERFPEVPPALRDHPVLERYARTFGELLSRTQKPSACSQNQPTAANAIYQKLIAPIGILGYGLATLDKTVAKLEALMAEHERDPAGFARALEPPEDRQFEKCCGGGADH